jgi:phosphoribosylaminoimidazole-succinocarboxamide synthase
MKDLTLKTNSILVSLFDEADLILVDFKIEFGLSDGKIYLGDEFTPDGCRVWDKETKKKLDKDRFRLGLGDVVESYQEIAHRLGIELT